jgi:hypothetical protein
MGQVAARIERAWFRPTTVANGGQFSCDVLVKQDVEGNVLETLVRECTDDSAWQLSLAEAIQSASPLPRPPSESVYASTLALTFRDSAGVADLARTGTDRASGAFRQP